MNVQVWRISGIGVALLLGTVFFFLWMKAAYSEPGSIRCTRRLQEYGFALALYASENGGFLPVQADANWRNYVPTRDRSNFSFLGNLFIGDCIYIYIGDGMPLEDAGDYPVVVEIPVGSHSWINILYGDGYVNRGKVKESPETLLLRLADEAADEAVENYCRQRAAWSFVCNRSE